MKLRQRVINNWLILEEVGFEPSALHLQDRRENGESGSNVTTGVV
jgi:hypothetical protein